MNIVIEFILYADDFPIDIVTKEIGINNFVYSKKGDIIYYGEKKQLHRVEDCTSIVYSVNSTDTNDLTESIQQMCDLLKPASASIITCMEKYNLTAKFCIVINLSDNPVIELSQEFIKLACQVNASVEFDSYVNYDDKGNVIL